MTDLQVTVPESVRSFIDEQSAAGKFNSPSELFIKLVEDAWRREAQAVLASKIREGLNSGEAIPVADEWSRQQRERLLATLPPGSLE